MLRRFRVVQTQPVHKHIIFLQFMSTESFESTMFLWTFWDLPIEDITHTRMTKLSWTPFQNVSICAQLKVWLTRKDGTICVSVLFICSLYMAVWFTLHSYSTVAGCLLQQKQKHTFASVDSNLHPSESLLGAKVKIKSEINMP